MALLFHPVSDLLRDKQDLLSELSLMRRVFESVTNGVSISDAAADDLPLIYVNPAFEKMTGYSSEEVLGRNCRFLQCGEAQETELAALRGALQGQQDVRVVIRNFTKEGAGFWNELYLSPIFNSAKRLTHYVGIQNDITARVELKRRMEYMALHDSLTDLANRSLAMDHLQQSLDRARRSNRMTAVLFVDLDGFKAINDRYGHECGDELLRAVAARIKLCIRASDCAARMGGDEFVVIASDLTEEADAYEVRARLASRIEEPLILSVADQRARIVPRSSIGLSLSPRDGEAPQALLKAADLSMYLDKKSRRERDVFYSEESA